MPSFLSFRNINLLRDGCDLAEDVSITLLKSGRIIYKTEHPNEHRSPDFDSAGWFVPTFSKSKKRFNMMLYSPPGLL